MRPWFAGLFLAVLLFGVNAPSSTIWQDTRSLYDAGKFKEAFELLQAHPSEDSNYYYNLGSIAYRLGRPGVSVAYLEKANRLEAHDPDIQHNLHMARSALARTLGADKMDPASNWLESLADRVAIDEIRGALGLLAVVLVLLWTRSYLKTRRLHRMLMRPAGIVVGIGFLITLSLYGANRYAADHPAAVFLDHAIIRSGPGEQFTQLAEGDPGAKLRVLGTMPQNGDLWLQVRYSQDGIGWVRASTLLLL